ncbi:unnamed protein product [Adineta steineri]|uniref:Uncharacterized protein n=1 Tax=Adineta steineri TaxID=433720 RepID=A0A820JP58_9BILA|nr:unnamed protein product [Adineta steineri]
MNKQNLNNSSSKDYALAHSFSRRQMTMMNSYLDSPITVESSSKSTSSTITDPHCTHCGKYYCQIDFIFSWLSRYGKTNDQQYVIDQRIQEIISKRLPTSDPQNVCEQRLLHWYNSTKIKLGNESISFPTSIIKSSVNKA